MGVNGTDHLESFEDVEAEFRVRDERDANRQVDVLESIGALMREVSEVRRETGDIRRVMVEGGAQFHHATDDTGSHDLRETYAKLKKAGSDPSSPLKPGDVRKIVREVTEEMELRADAGSWRAIKAQIRKYALKGLWLLLAAAGGGLGHWLAGRH